MSESTTPFLHPGASGFDEEEAQLVRDRQGNDIFLDTRSRLLGLVANILHGPSNDPETGAESVSATDLLIQLTRNLYIRVAAVFFILLALAHWHHSTTYLPSRFRGPSKHDVAPRYWTSTGQHLDTIPTWTKPANLSVKALIFYGRPASVSILDCYLKRNLVRNGGMLDEVIFVARTTKMQDLGWLNALLATEPAYTRRNLIYNDDGPRRDWRSAWDNLQNGTMYVKIDDDIVFFEDSTIPSMVQMRVEHPEYFIVSANIVNQPTLAWVHRNMGVVKPYLPELEPPPYLLDYVSGSGQQVVDTNNQTVYIDGNYTQGWRASELPLWRGAPSFRLNETYKPTYQGSRWLPVPPGLNITLDDTPIAAANYDPFGPAWKRWTIAAQQHYSFFEHLEKNELWRYKTDIWDYWYGRMGIQFMAIMGDDVWLAKNQTDMDLDDEYWFSEEMPRRTRRHGVIDGKAIAAHYAFGPQIGNLSDTDVLDRYRAFAKEMICVNND